ncbi:MAG: hypothetical protein PHI90_06530 [Clostridia bacterium]|nr:hypothetical protein [Clostridia bacterium]MDD4048466.1 hypothetical protein [Clostridia bacterium]
MQERLKKEIDQDIRKGCRFTDYCNIGVSDRLNTEILKDEVQAIDKVFENKKFFLLKAFELNDVIRLKEVFKKRARLFDQLRRKGFNCPEEKVKRLQELESKYCNDPDRNGMYDWWKKYSEVEKQRKGAETQNADENKEENKKKPVGLKRDPQQIGHSR